MNKVRIKTNYVYNKNGNNKVIFHMADIHFSNITKDSLFRKILDKVYLVKPDYIMITGDLIDSPEITKDRIRIKKFVNFLSCMGEVSKVLISIGNHDAYNEDDLKFFKKINELKNIYVLDNSKYVDDYIYVYGVTLPNEYYYNVSGRENSDIFLKILKKNYRMISGLPDNLIKICLCHSPMCLMNSNIQESLKEFDLLLSGHMHNGMVPPLIDKFGGHWGLINPPKELFPRICRGRIRLRNNELIITPGVTKLSIKSARAISNLNFIYNIDIDKIILTCKKGRYYGKN